MIENNAVAVDEQRACEVSCGKLHAAKQPRKPSRSDLDVNYAERGGGILEVSYMAMNPAVWICLVGRRRRAWGRPDSCKISRVEENCFVVLPPRTRRAENGSRNTGYIYVYIYIHLTFTCMYVCMYVCMHACMHVCMYVCVNTSLYRELSCIVYRS